jgi:hypothetical protein
MTGQQLCEAALHGDAAKVSALLSRQDAQSFINHQDEDGLTPLHFAGQQGHEAVTKQLIAARCNVDIQDRNGRTALQEAEDQGHTGIATLIRNKKQETPLLGSRVFIDGLVAKPELNRLTGTAVSFNDDKSGSGKVMMGQQLCEAALHGDAAKVSTLLSRQDAQSFIDHQDKDGVTSRPQMGVRPSRNSSLLLAVTSTSSLIMALLRCNLLSSIGTPESPR